MEQNQFDQYIEQAASKCLAAPSLVSLSEEQKQQMLQKIKEHFYNIILTTTFDNLTDEQFVQVKDLGPQDPLLAQKIEEFSSQMPFLAQAVQDKIDADSKYIEQTGQIPALNNP